MKYYINNEIRNKKAFQDELFEALNEIAVKNGTGSTIFGIDGKQFRIVLFEIGEE